MGEERMESSSRTQMERQCHCEGKIDCVRAAWSRPVMQFVLLCCMMHSAVGVVVFDLNACNEEVPCCIQGDVVAKTLGTITKSFCKIEYPVRTDTPWNASYALKRDRAAKTRLQELKDEGCAHEECKGFICAEYFPRCFWINDTARGAFQFQVCKKTCEDCYSTCAQDQSARCGENPSQLELACTSSSTTVQISWLAMIIAAVASFLSARHAMGR